ncbi:DUF2076 domain-containing protein [Buchnera aphidicola (Acyrthosiphon lactucae)]|uniref:DUF2076 domain-containing protein n=1 Tax=Buchnera aphidicola (Acyrthosiphon lactucae) TaxID=1241832 RepID=A0A4D6XRX7_9GAMM|nr:DUF2076 domain-containing protein [Buchnera aphidicola]QCI17588.1 DUF2076 domain-containing protein [Buchnera aphidicola (Acyrthosiphon lactucae)]
MKDEEKNLIENLFHRLKKTELNSCERDHLADDLIQNLVKKQPASSYYMVQTILIQETAIKKMNMKIEELKRRIKELNTEELNKKSSFLSGFFKKKPTAQMESNDNDLWRKKRDISSSGHSNATILPTTQPLPTVNSSNRSSSFLSSALQTATGVAGGMILGNMLMNVFSHTKPEEDIFDTVNKSSLESHREDDLLNHHNSNNNLINYESDESDTNSNESNLETINNDVYDSDDIDFDDSHFI